MYSDPRACNRLPSGLRRCTNAHQRMYSNEIRWLAMFKVFHLGYTFSDVVEDFKPWKIHEDTIQRWARRQYAIR